MKPFAYHGLAIAILAALSSQVFAKTKYDTCGTGDTVTCNKTSMSLETADETNGGFTIYLGQSGASAPSTVTIDEPVLKPTAGFMLENTKDTTVSLNVLNIDNYTYTKPKAWFNNIAIGVLNKNAGASLVFESSATITYAPGSDITNSFRQNGSVHGNSVLGAYSVNADAQAEMKSGTFLLKPSGGAVQAATHSRTGATATALMTGGTIRASDDAVSHSARVIEAYAHYSDNVRRDLQTETSATTKSTVRNHAEAKMTGGQIIFSHDAKRPNKTGAALFATNDWYGTAKATLLFNTKRNSAYTDIDVDSPYELLKDTDWDIDLTDMQGVYVGAQLSDFSRTNAQVDMSNARLRIRNHLAANKDNFLSAIHVRTAGNDQDNREAGQIRVNVTNSDVVTTRSNVSKHAEHSAIYTNAERGGNNAIFIRDSHIIANNAAVITAQTSRLVDRSIRLSSLENANQGKNYIKIENSTLAGAYGIISRVNNTADLRSIPLDKKITSYIDPNSPFHYALVDSTQIDDTNAVRLFNSRLYTTYSNEVTRSSAITVGTFEGKTNIVEIRNGELSAANYLIYDEDSLNDARVDNEVMKLDQNDLAGSQSYGGADTDVFISGTDILKHTSGNKISLGSGNDSLMLSLMSKASIENISLLDGGHHRKLADPNDPDNNYDELVLIQVGEDEISDAWTVNESMISIPTIDSEYTTFAENTPINWEAIDIESSYIKLTRDLKVSKTVHQVDKKPVRYPHGYTFEGGLTLGESSVLFLDNTQGLTLDSHILSRGESALVLGGIHSQSTQSITYTLTGNYYVFDDAKIRYQQPYLVIYSKLGDDQSPTSKLLIQGSIHTVATVSPVHTVVVIKNQGGLGAATQKGIPIIEVQGSEPSDEDFVLEDGEVSAGEYTYRLVRDGHVFYLRSADVIDDQPRQPTISPEARAYLITPYLLSQHTYDWLTPRLHRRVGEEQSYRWRGVSKKNLSWARVQVSGLRLENPVGSSMALDNSSAVQLGTDLILRTNREGKRQQMGLFATLGQFNTEVYHLNKGLGKLTGKFTGKLYGLSAYHTIFSPSSRYMDMVGGIFYMTQTYRPHRKSAQATQKAMGATASIEIGKTYGIHHAQDKWFVEPQAQFSAQFMHYQAVRTDGLLPQAQAYRDVALISRLGMRVGYRNLLEYKPTQGASTYVVANLFHRWAKNPLIQISTHHFREDNYPKLWYELGVGIQVPLRQQSMIYGGLYYQNAFKSTKTGLSGELGLRYQY